MNTKYAINGKATQNSSTDENKTPPALSKSPKSDGSQKRPRARPKPVYFWTNADVIKWLKRHCAELHPSYAHKFVEHDITGRSLIHMNDVNLEKLGIYDISHRDDIWREILKLRLKSDILELRDFQIKGNKMKKTPIIQKTGSNPHGAQKLAHDENK